MTKTLLTGITLATILFALGMSAQSYAMPMPDKTQNDILSYTLASNPILDQQLMLISEHPTTKGGKTVFHLIPRPQKAVDDIEMVAQANLSQLILASDPTTGGGTALKLVPKPQEGIDGISIPKPTIPTDNTPAAVNVQSLTILASYQTTGGGTALKLIPKPQEGIDGIPIPKEADHSMMLVSTSPISKGGMAVLHLVAQPAPDPRDNVS